MPLTNEQLNQAQAHVRQHFKKCPCCETNSGPPVADKFGAITTWEEEGNLFNPSNGMQVIMTVCSNCGYVMIFRAQNTGVL